MKIDIKITGDKDVQTKLKRLGSSITYMRDAMENIGDDAAKYYSSKAFDSRGGVFGARWIPLNAKYAARKAKRYPGRPPLVATGDMRDSFTYVASSNQVIVSNSAPYYKYHQSTLGRTIMPRRAMAGINEPIKKIVKDRIKESISLKIKGA